MRFHPLDDVKGRIVLLMVKKGKIIWHLASLLSAKDLHHDLSIPGPGVKI
jgi:hypothetical protein